MEKKKKTDKITSSDQNNHAEGLGQFSYHELFVLMT